METRPLTPDEVELWNQPAITEQLPFQVGKFTLTSYTTKCNACEEPPRHDCDFRGTLTQYSRTCVHIRGMMFCRDCNLFTKTSHRIRDYGTITVMEWEHGKLGWVRSVMLPETRWGRVREWVKRKFFKIWHGTEYPELEK